MAPNSTILSPVGGEETVQEQARSSLILNAIGFLCLLSLVSRWWHYYRRTPKVTSVGFLPIPYIGSWVAAIRFMRRPVDVVREGMAKSRNGVFRIASLSDELILVTDKEKVAEYLRAPDSILSMQDGANDQQQIPYTLGYGVAYRTYHNSVVKKQVTPNIPNFSDAMVDEMAASFTEQIGKPKDWTPVALYDVTAMTVARVSNRVFVGEPYCTNVEHLRNATDYAQAVVISAEILRLFPEWAKGVLVKVLPVTTCMRRAMKILGDEVTARLEGKYAGGKKPEDLIQWLIDAAPPVESTPYQIVERVMALNVASIHTTTMTFTAALYTLGADPEKYVDTLREEVHRNLENGKVTHKTIQNCIHMDSFIRESARMNVSGLGAMQRNAKQAFKFSDGTVIPVGAKLMAPTLILSRDPASYENPQEFQGFRFVKKGDDGVPVLEKQAVTTGTDYHLYGHGRHPCPGRFFATEEMKLMFATLLLNYDMKLAPGTAPKELRIGTMALPDTNLKVLFKARSVDA
ncbi:cytochrome P450 [Sporormia fimetaria CBS 119925]|uniref:Cytochrome P450 n=1 Tax=Sporormia fimetaria CBS 119925 TaxID=1340428 RepID=A0A6A6UX26_9PLEO|nr:cytochrome P450 [Sporormia fimetaria CBS 119925]